MAEPWLREGWGVCGEKERGENEKKATSKYFREENESDDKMQERSIFLI